VVELALHIGFVHQVLEDGNTYQRRRKKNYDTKCNDKCYKIQLHERLLLLVRLANVRVEGIHSPP
jgi:hypothetical protein